MCSTDGVFTIYRKQAVPPSRQKDGLQEKTNKHRPLLHPIVRRRVSTRQQNLRIRKITLCISGNAKQNFGRQNVCPSTTLLQRGRYQNIGIKNEERYNAIFMCGIIVPGDGYRVLQSLSETWLVDGAFHKCEKPRLHSFRLLSRCILPFLA